MPKATHTHTTPTPAPDVARTKRAARGTKTPRNTRPAVQAPPAKPAAAPPDDALARMLWLASETDEGWRRRDPTNKAMCAVTGAAERLGGLSNVCWDLCFAEMAKGGRNAKDGTTSPYSFLAQTLADISRGLKQAHRLYWNEMQAEDEAALRTGRAAV
jgi:hypothetical protein